MNLRTIALPLAALAFCAGADTVEITVSNPAAFPRKGEMVEVDESAVRFAIDTPSFILTDPSGKEIAWQSTHDGKIVFQADVPAGGSALYTAIPGTPAPVEAKVYGRLFRERADDMTWENEHAAYRAYGPAMQRNGERGFGYDIWTKSVPRLVTEKRYYLDKRRHISFHKDHGEGHDPYTVGPTLGGGTAALLDKKGEIIFPWCWSEAEVLDRGPLRFCVRLHYRAASDEKKLLPDETRVITLDAGDWFNRTEVTWTGFKGTRDVVAGPVVHKQNPDGYVIDPSSRFVAVADLTEDASAGNGTIFVGAVAESEAVPVYMPLPKPVGDAIGHAVLKGSVADGSPFIYWWGSAWSKGDVESMEAWTDILKAKRDALDNPLTVSVNYKK